MKLNNDSIFNKATIVILIDDKLYYKNANCYLFDTSLFESDVPGLLIYSGIEYSGRCAFWIEDDDVFPIVKCNDKYLLIEYDNQYEYLKSHDELTKEQIRLIEEGLDVLITGGLIDYIE